MTAIPTTVRVGHDGILRFEVPIDQRDQDVNVVLVVEASEPAEDTPGQLAPELRRRLEAAGLRVPSSSKWHDRRIELIRLNDGGPPASEFLISERR